jgi:cyclopropane fatty-acyl-phospholipid synthase-like methyltransferase
MSLAKEGAHVSRGDKEVLRAPTNVQDDAGSTHEPQYQVCLDLERDHGLYQMGLMSSFAYHDDPKRLAFTLARYKFAAKMLSGSKHVLEVGCADAFATRIVLQEVTALTAIDFDPIFVADVKRRMDEKWKFTCHVHDMLWGPVPGQFDGAYSLDVFEHIAPEREHDFMRNLTASLTPRGAVVIGIPSLQSQAYASAGSKAGHINCKDQGVFKKFMQRYFENVFMFSMSDEVVHTGYGAMSHYNIALACGKKPDR